MGQGASHCRPQRSCQNRGAWMISSNGLMVLANQSIAAAARRARAREAIAYNSPRAAEIVCSARRAS
jgi:hypothetical protein